MNDERSYDDEQRVLNEAELADVTGGGLFGWIEDNIFEPAMALLRGNRPPPNLHDPENPFGRRE
ncbi:MAG: hypothetical protein ABW217_01310 [Polyangiaceae bacterium]